MNEELVRPFLRRHNEDPLIVDHSDSLDVVGSHDQHLRSVLSYIGVLARHPNLEDRVS